MTPLLRLQNEYEEISDRLAALKAHRSQLEAEIVDPQTLKDPAELADQAIKNDQNRKKIRALEAPIRDIQRQLDSISKWIQAVKYSDKAGQYRLEVEIGVRRAKDLEKVAIELGIQYESAVQAWLQALADIDPIAKALDPQPAPKADTLYQWSPGGVFKTDILPIARIEDGQMVPGRPVPVTYNRSLQDQIRQEIGSPIIHHELTHSVGR